LGERLFDLLGDPIPERWGEPGRPEHIATAENCNKVRLLLVSSWTLSEIASEIGVSVPTLRKHYFASGKVDRVKARQIAIREVKGRVALQLDKAAAGGSVPAMKELYRLADQASLQDRPPADAKAPKPPPPGKKARTAQEAKRPTGDWGDLGLPGVTRPN